MLSRLIPLARMARLAVSRSLEFSTRIRSRPVVGSLVVAGAVGGGIGLSYASGGGVSFVNSPNDIVTEAIDGLVLANPGFARLDGYPEVKVIVRSDWVSPENQHKVAIISGGGAGHEPAHAGFVGRNMLTGAVSGDIFASPSAFSILAAIRTVAYPGGEAQKKAKKSPGVLLIIKNYTGDRINFKIAAERARAEGIPIEMVVVADDCAIPKSKGVTGRRGIAGTVLVHKVAGAAAEAGLSLKQVAAEARKVAQNVASIGVSASVCSIPGRPESSRIGQGEMEMGLGIHGEPGAEKIKTKPVKEIVSSMVSLILDDSKDRGYMSLNPLDDVVILVNSLGSTTPMEISIATSEALNILQNQKAINVRRVVTGPLMTSMDMAGFSLSILKLPKSKFEREKLLLRLDAETNAPGWPRGGGALTRGPTDHLLDFEREKFRKFLRPEVLTANGRVAEDMIRSIAFALKAAEPELTAWDLKVGDGDCGETFKLGSMAALEDIKTYPLNDPADTLEAITGTVARSMGGTSGALYRIFLLSLCASARQNGVSGDTKLISSMFSKAVEAVVISGGAKEGDRTMLDALIPAARSLEHSAQNGVPLIIALEKAVIKAEVGAESTRSMEARAGRSNYIPKEVLSATPDPGSKAAAIWMRAAYESFLHSY